jgi:hypothetical protein
MGSDLTEGDKHLSSTSFGCLERVDFGLGRCDSNDMSGQIAVTAFPLNCRFGTRRAVPTRFNLGGTAASLARSGYFMAQPAVVAATFGGHEYALGTFADRLTNHGNHLPSQISQIMTKKNSQSQTRPAIFSCWHAV